MDIKQCVESCKDQEAPPIEDTSDVQSEGSSDDFSVVSTSEVDQQLEILPHRPAVESPDRQPVTKKLFEEICSVPCCGNRLRIYHKSGCPGKYYYDPEVKICISTLHTRNNRFYFKIRMWNPKLEEHVVDSLKRAGYPVKDADVQIVEFDRVELVPATEETLPFRLSGTQISYHELNEKIQVYVSFNTLTEILVFSGKMIHDLAILFDQLALKCWFPAPQSSKENTMNEEQHSVTFKLDRWSKDYLYDGPIEALRYDRMFASRPVVDDQFDEEDILIEQIRDIQSRVQEFEKKIEKIAVNLSDLGNRLLSASNVIDMLQKKFTDSNEEVLHGRSRQLGNSRTETLPSQSNGSGINASSGSRMTLHQRIRRAIAELEEAEKIATEQTDFSVEIEGLLGEEVADLGKPVERTNRVVPAFSACTVCTNHVGKYITFSGMETLVDAYGTFDEASGLFTVKTAGQYLLLFNGMYSIHDITYVYLCVNNVARARSCARSKTRRALGLLSINVMINLKEGDTVGVWLDRGRLCESPGLPTRFAGIFYGAE